MSILVCFFSQIRSSITTLLFSGREFSWLRHMLIAAAILAFNNMLVIFVPTIRDIFGFIGKSCLRIHDTEAHDVLSATVLLFFTKLKKSNMVGKIWFTDRGTWNI